MQMLYLGSREVQTECQKGHEFLTESISMGDKYAVKLSITYLVKISRKWRKSYNGRNANVVCTTIEEV